MDSAARQYIARAVAVVGLAGVGLVHLLDIIGKFNETPYMGWMYVGLIIACVVAAAALIRSNSREAWVAALLLPLAAIIGFTLTRTVGLPQATDDIGNWAEPLGLASLFVEVCLVGVAGAAIMSLAPKRLRRKNPALVTA